MESQSKKSQRAQLCEQMDAEWDHSVSREQKANQFHSQIQGHNEQIVALDK